MTTITRFTKEQLTEIIESADDVIKALAGTHDDIHPHSDAMCRAWDWLNDNSAPPEVVKRLAEIALKELTDSGKLAAAEQRIAELEAKLANPVLLPKTNGYWTEQEKAYEEAITLAKRQVRLAGFRCEGDE